MVRWRSRLQRNRHPIPEYQYPRLNLQSMSNLLFHLLIYGGVCLFMQFVVFLYRVVTNTFFGHLINHLKLWKTAFPRKPTKDIRTKIEFVVYVNLNEVWLKYLFSIDSNCLPFRKSIVLNLVFVIWEVRKAIETLLTIWKKKQTRVWRERYWSRNRDRWQTIHTPSLKFE